MKGYTIRLVPEQDEDGEHYAVSVDECPGLLEEGTTLGDALDRTTLAVQSWERAAAL